LDQAALKLLEGLLSDRKLCEVLSSQMGAEFVLGLVQSLEGEKDPRCLVVGLSSLRMVQAGFAPSVVEETCEAVFDATACYFPVTFTPPPNDPHKINPDDLKQGLQAVLVGSPCMAAHAVPMMLDKLASEVPAAKEAAMKGLVASVKSFSLEGALGSPMVSGSLGDPVVAGAGAGEMNIGGIGDALFEEVVRGGDPSLSSLALSSLSEVARLIATRAELLAKPEACVEWLSLSDLLLRRCVREAAGPSPASMLGRGCAKVMKSVAASSALGLRSTLALADPLLLPTPSSKSPSLSTSSSTAPSPPPPLLQTS
ncbi:unnamed protein product, partial [Discosporangium mesarthrocarpum]